MYAWCLERIPADKIEEWLFQLSQPLPGQETKVTDAMIEDEGAGFMAFMAQHQSNTAGA